ncbi:fibroblast growth factor receptor 1-like isoform X2 [Daphnia carinata]|uniref:fibroblast growth factor receptor 1-like isoform X2 n=1 Tax=Daphnia carinata TaxID=120202 RepID=UPI00257FE0E3|nr:fibroblast growth factor receptor 1-like isoform X2 [Daphnia carinata]
MERLSTIAQSVCFRSIIVAVLITWTSPTLCKTIRHHCTPKLSSLYAYEGDNIAFRCPEKLEFSHTDRIHPSVEWYFNNGVETKIMDRKKHRRLRFSIRRNSIHIDNVQREDEGVWAALPRSAERFQHDVGDSRLKTLATCNFTLGVLENRKNPTSPSRDSQIRTPAWEEKSFELSQEIKDHPFIENSHSNLSHQNRRFSEQRKSLRLISKRIGESLALKCPNYGYRSSSQPIIEWRKNGKTIQHSKNRNQWLLKIQAITKKDSGEYECVVSNSHGSVNFAFHLTVLRKDAVLKPKLLGMQNVTVRVGDTARLNCSMASQGFSTVEWLLQTTVNGSNVDSTGAPFFEILDVDYSDGKDRRILSIENVTHEDNGKYFCVVKNKHGTSVQSSWLIVM